MTAYYQCLNRTNLEDGSCISSYQPTLHTQGAWNDNEQHMAPATGLLIREILNFKPRKDMQIGRISLDILGLIPLEPFTITTRVIRPGRTIELVEAAMFSEGRDAIIARAWRLVTQDTHDIAGIEDVPSIYNPDELPSWPNMSGWPGGFIRSLCFAAEPNLRPGKGTVWVTTETAMIEQEASSDMVRLLGLVDTANGIVPRTDTELSESEWVFPNTDLQIHMHRLPKGQWLGMETVQQFGSNGIGLTSSVLHDIHGPFGRSEQILTIRPI